MSYLLLIVGLSFLIKGADWLVMGASAVARRYNVSEFVIGLTVVSFGTSLPELVVGVVAGIENNPGITIGNVVGSNLANILLVLGVAAIISPLPATNNTVWREIPFTLFASLVLAALLNDQLFERGAVTQLGRGDGLILLAFFLVFLYYVAQSIRSDQERGIEEEHAEETVGRSLLEMGGGLVGLTVGGQLTVTSAVDIAESLGLSDVFIGLTVIAIGTSLPELATSAIAAYRKNVDIAVGNIVGSNIFNIFIVLGISSLVRPLPFDMPNNFDVIAMLLATVLLFVLLFVGIPKRTVQRREGVVLLVLYFVYLGLVVYRESP